MKGSSWKLYTGFYASVLLWFPHSSYQIAENEHIRLPCRFDWAICLDLPVQNPRNVSKCLFWARIRPGVWGSTATARRKQSQWLKNNSLLKQEEQSLNPQSQMVEVSVSQVFKQIQGLSRGTWSHPPNQPVKLAP